MSAGRVAAGVALVAALASAIAAQTVPHDFPRFHVPGRERQMESLRRLYWLHYEHAGPLIPLWDEWMPMATLWPARGDGPPAPEMRRRWATALAGRTLNAEGYVHTRQHDGPAHAEGWPFPFWSHAGGAGWHFRPIGVPGYDLPTVNPEGWKLVGAVDAGVQPLGWRLELAEPRATIETPPLALDANRSPWLRINWRADGLAGASCYVEWTTAAEPGYGPQRRMHFAPADAAASPSDAAAVETRTMIPLYRAPAWRGTVTRLRIAFDNRAPAVAVVKSLHTASDTRHNVNNLNFIRGAHDYFLWSRDLAFLRDQIGRLRQAMRFVEREFQTRQRRCVYTAWPGHEGRSGVRYVDGVKTIVPGEGVGSNYWDLLPFGGEDALATIYYYDALHDLAALEEAIRRRPEWNIPPAADAYDPADLRRHAAEVKEYAGERFWNSATGRFGTLDLDGALHDYGFTFLNNEAVYYGLAAGEQARSIHEWLSGSRTVAGDTSTGRDVYHWRFGPRSTTRRNVDYYVWTWSAPESIPWGYQVQDGGAVLGWSYHDLMARLRTAGPDDAAARLAEIVAWFDETQAAGGYREYYARDPARGTLQGGNVPGGLGLDREFFESVLVPQAMLYGFLGFRPAPEGFALDPRLPRDWPELSIDRIHLHDGVLRVTARQDGSVHVVGEGYGDAPLEVDVPPSVRLTVEGLSIRRPASGDVGDTP